MLIEVARQRGNYLPELSFGTHFFQDLVEASIRYLPLYPDDPSTMFHEPFFRRSRNVLQEVLPEFAHLAETLRVTDVPLETGGLILRVLMNADLNQAVGFLSSPQQNIASVESEAESIDRGTNDHWRWRFRMAQRIAVDLDPQKFGVNAFYLIGSTKNATAGPASDIDILLHVQGNEEQRKELSCGSRVGAAASRKSTSYGLAIAQMGLLDVHLVSDTDIKGRSNRRRQNRRNHGSCA